MAKLKTWFHQVLRNRCLDALRSKLQRFPGKTQGVHPTLRSLENLLLSKQNHPQLKLAIEALTAQERAAIILHYYQGLPHPEVATKLGLSLPALDTLLVKVQQQLQQERLSHLRN